MRFHFATAILIAAITALSGCQFTPYGAAAPYSYFETERANVVLPANAPSITQQFRKLPEDQASHAPEDDHLGLDILEKVGVAVLAAADGTVMRSYSDAMYGNQVIVQHGKDQTGVPVTTVYKHLDTRSAKAGDKVRRGQQIGTMGTTGLLSQGHPHLHFELLRKMPDGRMLPVDPQFQWVSGPGKVTCFRKGRHYRKSPVKLTYPVICKRK